MSRFYTLHSPYINNGDLYSGVVKINVILSKADGGSKLRFSAFRTRKLSYNVSFSGMFNTRDYKEYFSEVDLIFCMDVKFNLSH